MAVVPDPSSQPNLVEDGGTFPVKFWLLVVLTGMGAGLNGAGLMRPLYAVQHVAWNYETGTFLAAVSQTTAVHWVLVLVGVGQRLVRQSYKGTRAISQWNLAAISRCKNNYLDGRNRLQSFLHRNKLYY